MNCQMAHTNPTTNHAHDPNHDPDPDFESESEAKKECQVATGKEPLKLSESKLDKTPKREPEALLVPMPMPMMEPVLFQSPLRWPGRRVETSAGATQGTNYSAKQYLSPEPRIYSTFIQCSPSLSACHRELLYDNASPQADASFEGSLIDSIPDPDSIYANNTPLPVPASTEQPTNTHGLPLVVTDPNMLPSTREGVNAFPCTDSKPDVNVYPRAPGQPQKAGDNPESALDISTLYKQTTAKVPMGNHCCNCKKSRCLKLYCDCFASGDFCRGCNCFECHNNLAYEEETSKARVAVSCKNPGAFKRRLPNDVEGPPRISCNCARSGCLKKYCECFKSGHKCGRACNCTGCSNTLPTRKRHPKPVPILTSPHATRRGTRHLSHQDSC